VPFFLRRAERLSRVFAQPVHGGEDERFHLIARHIGQLAHVARRARFLRHERTEVVAAPPWHGVGAALHEQVRVGLRVVLAERIVQVRQRRRQDGTRAYRHVVWRREQQLFLVGLRVQYVRHISGQTLDPQR